MKVPCVLANGNAADWVLLRNACGGFLNYPWPFRYIESSIKGMAGQRSQLIFGLLWLNRHCSLTVSGTAFAALAIYRDRWIVSLVVGSLVNAAAGKLLKRALKTK